jgi:hypothetical protein
MTVSEMHTAFRLHLDKSTSLVGNPDFLSEEIDFWLNEAQDRFIKQRIYGNNYRQEGFEQTQKRVDDLRGLLINSTGNLLTQSTIAVNVKECSLPVSDATSPYMFYINSSLVGASSTTMQVKNVVQYEYITEYLKDTMNNPYIRRPLVTFYGNKIAFIHGDEFVPLSCNLRYIKKPKKLVYGTPGTYETNTSELSFHTHSEIVILAVSLVVENTENPRVQTFEQLNASKVE